MRKYNFPGNIHFVTTRTNGNEKFFADEKVCDLFLENLDELRKELKFKVFGFCLMPDHVHLLIQLRVASNSFEVKNQAPNEFGATQREGISDVIKRIKGGSSRKINKYLNQSGNFWQTGFYDFNIYSQKKFWEKLNYIHSNPLKAGLIDDISLYKYSSWRNYELSDNSIFKIEYVNF